MDTQIWYPIPGASKYEFNCLTHDIRNNKSGRLVKGVKEPGKYRQLCLMADDGKPRTFYVHRIVAELFIPRDNPFTYMVNHKNGNKIDNRIENLEWVTSAGNVHHWASSVTGISPEEYRAKALRAEALRLITEKTQTHPSEIVSILNSVVSQLQMLG